MNRLKITYLCTNADLAGAPIHVRTLILGLHQRAEVNAIFGECGPIVEDLEAIGVRCTVLTRMRSAISPLNDLIVLFQLIKVLRLTSPDLVHMHSAKAAMLGRIACMVTKTPWVYTVHGWGWRGFGKIKSGLMFFIEKTLSYCTNGFYIYVSKSVEADASAKLRINPSVGRVVFNGVEDAAYIPEPIGPLKILMAARVCNAKDHETLIRAFDTIKIPSTLILCGEGTDSAVFKSLVLNWAPQRNSEIELLGVCKNVALLLQSINVFALISNFEALPLSIIEAMANNRVVIASDVGGVTELIRNNTSGLTVPKGDTEKLAQGLIRLQDPSFRSYLAKNARFSYQENFKKSDMLTSVWNIYLKTVNDTQR
jgi:glycosyltransferase involved in cell wall biosynthesis